MGGRRSHLRNFTQDALYSDLRALPTFDANIVREPATDLHLVRGNKGGPIDSFSHHFADGGSSTDRTVHRCRHPQALEELLLHLRFTVRFGSYGPLRDRLWLVI